MAKTCRVTDVEILMNGVREVLKSDYVKGLLDGQGAKAAAKCNALYSMSTTPRKDPYAYKVEELSYTAAAIVHSNSTLGKYDNIHHNTLRKGCGL